MARDRKARVTRLVLDEIRRLAPEGGVSVAVDMRTGANAGWLVTVRQGDVAVSALLAGSDEDPYALPEGLFAVVARDLLADVRTRAQKGGAMRERRNRGGG